MTDSPEKNPTEDIDKIQNQLYADYLEKREKEINRALNSVLSTRNSKMPDSSKYSTFLAVVKILVIIAILILVLIYGPR